VISEAGLTYLPAVADAADADSYGQISFVPSYSEAVTAVFS
jgi:hypothetical protein